MPSLRKLAKRAAANHADASIPWNGSGMSLAVNQNAVMAQTSNGTMVFGWVNLALQNNQGTLSVTSGGSAPTFLQAPALAAQPSFWINNFGGNNLSVTNISVNLATPIWIAAYGPGVPGQVTGTLPTNGTPVSMATGQSVQNKVTPQYWQLVMTSSTAMLCIFAVIGGPPDQTGNNGYVFAVNATSNTGPGTGVTPPPGYYATTTSNSYAFQFNWGSSNVYVVNLSPATASAGQVLLRAL